MMQSVETAPVNNSYHHSRCDSGSSVLETVGAKVPKLSGCCFLVHSFLACGLSTLWGILGQHCESVLEL